MGILRGIVSLVYLPEALAGILREGVAAVTVGSDPSTKLAEVFWTRAQVILGAQSALGILVFDQNGNLRRAELLKF